MAQLQSSITLRKHLRAPIDPVIDLAWSQDGRQFAVVFTNSSIHLGDVSARWVDFFLEKHSDSVRSLSWSRDENYVASGSADRTVRIWDVRTRKTVNRLLGHDQGVVMVRWAPNGQMLASCSTDGTVRLWSKDGNSIHCFSDLGYVPVNCIAWKPDSLFIVAGLANGEVAFLDVVRQKSRKLPLSEHAVLSAEWLLNDDLQLFGLADGTVRVWDQRDDKQLFVLEGHSKGVETISLSFDETLAATSGDGVVRFWRIGTWQPIDIGSELNGFYSRVAFHPRTAMFAVLSERNWSVEIWDVEQNFLQDTNDNQAPTYYTSVKVVLVGESNAGKSCLALRVAEDRYEEQGTTHGLRFWSLPWE